MEPLTISATGDRRGFTLVEILLVLALLGLLSWIFIGGSTALLRDQGASPDDQFWKACGAARKEALQEQKTVLLSFDAKTRAFVLNDGDQKVSLPFTGSDEIVVDFHPIKSDSSSEVLIGGTVVDTTPMAAASFYSDGTCTAFRAQVRTKGGAHMLGVDPWTCAPEIIKADAT
ncbi:MAG TPA: prepilin-type N-terminal cleavage/methylation domain-containing protein [Opitutaceae bacterium]